MGDVLAYEAELLGLVREVGALFCSSLSLKRAGSEALKRRSAIRPRVRCSHKRGGLLRRSEWQRCLSGARIVLPPAPRVPAACACVTGLAAELRRQLMDNSLTRLPHCYTKSSQQLFSVYYSCCYVRPGNVYRCITRCEFLSSLQSTSFFPLPLLCWLSTEMKSLQREFMLLTR